MSELDCESFRSAMLTLAGLLGLHPQALRSLLAAIPLRKFDALLAHAEVPPRQLLWELLLGKRTEVPVPREIFWFHATRVPRGTTFHDGIQPLGERLAAIKEFLTKLITDHGIEHAGPPDGGGHSGYLYRMKTVRRSSWGPFGFLVRDEIVKPSGVNHDYLRTPEIVEDLAAVLVGTNDRRLLEAFRDATVPSIVKFRSCAPREDVVPTALYYCYMRVHRKRCGFEGNMCFSGEGVGVPADDVVRLDHLE